MRFLSIAEEIRRLARILDQVLISSWDEPNYSLFEEERFVAVLGMCGEDLQEIDLGILRAEVKGS
jgi:hypothetical protein